MYSVVLGNVLWNITNRYLLFVLAEDSSKNKKKIIAVCHITVYNEKTTNQLVGDYGIVVLKDYRGKGIGKLLSVLAMRIAKEMGVSVLMLTVDVDNERAIKLYERLGFRIHKCIHKGDYRHITNEYVDYYIMIKHL